MDSIRLMGTPVACATYDSALTRIKALAREPRASAVCPSNTHIIGEARHNPEFARILGQFDLVLPDGMPVVCCVNERNLGAVANCNRVFELSTAPLFMSAAHDDLQRHDYQETCVRLVDDIGNEPVLRPVAAANHVAGPNRSRVERTRLQEEGCPVGGETGSVQPFRCTVWIASKVDVGRGEIVEALVVAVVVVVVGERRNGPFEVFRHAHNEAHG